jgi:alpha-1,3-mannosyl-glycoprotein beta-1,2-N-acetylglucosaminyltransferase
VPPTSTAPAQDGNESSVAAVAGALAPDFLRTARGFEFWQKSPRVAALGAGQAGHAWLAQHYRWGLDRLFLERRHSHAVIVEDDMLFSPDFLLYFEAVGPLLDADPTLWCASTWNDNGFAAGHAWSPSRLFRTSYFPGLGWMMKRELWLELGPKWPLDHWVRRRGGLQGARLLPAVGSPRRCSSVACSRLGTPPCPPPPPRAASGPLDARRRGVPGPRLHLPRSQPQQKYWRGATAGGGVHNFQGLASLLAWGRYLMAAVDVAAAWCATQRWHACHGPPFL